jgi:TonB family protein
MWSLGAMLVEALTQKPPFAPETTSRDRGVPASVPEPFRGIARECLHDDPKRRCSIADVKARMQPAARSVPDQTPLVAAAKPRRNDQSIWRLLIPIAILLIFVVGVRALYKAYSQKSSADAPSKTDAAPVASEPEKPNAASPSATPPAKKPTAALAAPIRQSPAQPKKTASAAPGEVLLRVVPDVPRSAKNTISGTIKVEARLDVDASGKVKAVRLTTPGPSRYFAGLAEKAARQWQFSPLDASGKAAESTWLLKFHFERSGTQVDALRVSR